MARAEGFAAVPTWMIRDRKVPRNAVLVYASLSSRAGLGVIYPSQTTIAEESGLSERTVRTMLTELERLGVVTRERRKVPGVRRATDAYSLHPNGLPATSAASSDLPADLPANGPRSTGNEQQATPSIEVENVEVDRDLLSPDESDDLGTLIPDDWRPNLKHVDKAASLRMDVKNEYQRFRAHAECNHRRQKNWNAAFTNWLQKGAVMAQQRAGSSPQTFARQRQSNALSIVESYRQKEENREEVRSGAAPRLQALDGGH